MNEQRWYRCPVCRKKLFPLRTDTVIRRMPCKCRACRNEFEVNIPEPRAFEPRAD